MPSPMRRHCLCSAAPCRLYTSLSYLKNRGNIPKSANLSLRACCAYQKIAVFLSQFSKYRKRKTQINQLQTRLRQLQAMLKSRKQIEEMEGITAKQDSDLIHFYHLEAVETAVCYKHYGPYEGLFDSYSQLFAFAEKEGYQVIDTPRAVYVDGIWNQEDSSKWLTIIQLPVTR